MFLIADNTGKAETININAYPTSMHFGNSDQFYFDRYSGKLLKYLPDTKKSRGMKLNDLNYDIHVGQILGLTGKIIAFVASLISASLPVTGFIIWLGKRKKKVKPRRSKPAIGQANEVTHRPHLRHPVLGASKKQDATG